MAQHGVEDSLLQRLLSRLDHIEYRLMADSREEIAQVKSSVEHMREARLQEQHDNMIADMLAAAPRVVSVPTQQQAVASHRGPGAISESKLPRPLPAGHAGVASPDPSQTSMPDVKSEASKGSPGQRAFSNALVKARQGTPDTVVQMHKQ